jgi:hypothetical protein
MGLGLRTGCIYVLSLRYVDSTDAFVLWFWVRNSTIPGAGKGLFVEQAFPKKGADIGVYFGAKVSKDTVSNESMYLIYSSSSLKENCDAVRGFGSYSPVFMGIHFVNDPRHHTYYVTANGSARSIYEWSKRPRHAIDENTPPTFDKDQKRAFQVIVAHFVVTYYREAEFNFINRTGPQEYLNNRNLEKMINGKKRLLMFFSGGGGSGKTAVINQ